jgi:hypothetical protein
MLSVVIAQCSSQLKIWSSSSNRRCNLCWTNIPEKNKNTGSYVVFHLAGLGFELARKALYHLTHHTSPFCFRYFSNRVSHLCLGRTGSWSPYLCFPPGWDDRCVAPCLGDFFVCFWDRVLLTFCPGWPPWTLIFPISAS